MAVYGIALINIDDRDGYSTYEQGFFEVFSKYRGELLAVDEAPRVKEGKWDFTRTVIVKFPSETEFNRWYHSDEYQALAKHRFKASAAHLAVVNAFEPPQ